MQRKGCILKKSFSLLFTLFFIIIIATIGLMSMQFSAATTKHTANTSMDMRAELMLRSSTEFAIMAMQGHDYSKNCLKHINLSDTFFDANITFHYFLTTCPSSCGSQCSAISTADTNGTALIYVTVTSKNPYFNIRKVRFTIQNP